MANLVDELMKAVKPKKDKPNKTHAATVSHIDKDGTVWVYVAGSDRETPTASAASEVKKGDSVNVEWRNNKLYIAGNYSNPSAGVTRVVNVENIANVANSIATQANQSAAVAQDAADRAIRDADAAHQAAVDAQNSADEAQTSADQAQESADSAKESADRSLVQLSIVEDVAGTLNWISEHGTYTVTADTSVQDGTVYFELVDGDYVPIAQPDPTANPSTEGWYVLDVTDSTSEYIMAHLAVTSAGLWVLPSGQWGMHAIVDSDGNYIVDANGDYIADWQIDPVASGGYKVLLSATGMTVYDGSGVAVANYSNTVTIGKSGNVRVLIDNDSLDIVDGSDEVLATFGADGARIGKEDESRVEVKPDSTEFYDDYNGLVGEITQGQSGAMWQYEALSEDDYDMLNNRTLEYQLQKTPIEHTDMQLVVCVLPITEATVSSNPPVHTFMVSADSNSTDTYTNGSNSISYAYNASTRTITLTTTGNGLTQTVVQQKGTKDDVWDAVDQSANIPLPLTGHTIELTSIPAAGTTISGSYFAGQWYTFSFSAGTSATHGNQGSSYPYQCYEAYDASAQTITIIPNTAQAATILDYYRISYTSATLLLYADSTYVKYRIAVGTPSYTFGKRVSGSTKGNYSFVTGYNNTATEDLSTVFGRDTHATEENQMVIGRNSKDEDLGFGFLMGNGTFQPSNAFGITWGGTPYMQLDTQGRYGDNFDYYSDAELTEALEELWTIDYLKSDGTIRHEMLNLKKLLAKTLTWLNVIGKTYYNNKFINLPASDSTYVEGGTLTLPAGIYLIIATGGFASSSSEGTKRVQIYNKTTSVANTATAISSKWGTQIQAVNYVDVRNNTTFACRMSSSVALSNCSAGLSAVRVR